MVGNFVRLSLSMLLILLSLPFLAISFLIAALCAAVASLLPRFHRQQRAGAMARVKPRTAEQFGFDDALSAYENLIGAHAWKRP